jgi:hypothetical protein
MMDLLLDKKHSPSVKIDKSGKVTIKGELRTENPDAFFQELETQLETKLDLIGLEKEDLLFVFIFEYLGSSNTMALFTYVQLLEASRNKMIWVFLEDDEDIEEIGEIIKVGYAPSITLMTLDQYQ